MSKFHLIKFRKQSGSNFLSHAVKTAVGAIVSACMFVLISTNVRAQNANNQKGTVEYYINHYMFDEAEQALNQSVRRLRRRGQSTEAEEQMLDNVSRMRMMMDAVERVTFIDSVTVNKSDFLSVIRLSDESGRIIPYSSFFRAEDAMGQCMVYENELANRIIYAKPVTETLSMLYMSDLINGEWSETRKLAELDAYPQGFPFLLSDGLTLYFGAMGEESIGGYDIFVTRYDDDEKCFLAPENVGMPFNSPANDYMLAIDEYNELGWLVTDRNQPDDTVCVYVFVPNDTRRVYDSNLYEQDVMAGLAMVSSVADTWDDKALVAEAKKRLQEVRTDEQKVVKQKDFEFIINDKLTYTCIEDFKSKAARVKMQTWLDNSAQYKKDKEYLASLRTLYITADEEERLSLKPQILLNESDCEKEQVALHALSKEIRNAENEVLQAMGE